MTSPYVTKETRYFDMPFLTPIFSETRPGRIGTTSLKKTELVETRGDRERDEDAEELDGFEGTADHRGGFPTPSSGHAHALTSYPNITYTFTRTRKHATCAGFSDAFSGCKSCGDVQDAVIF